VPARRCLLAPHIRAVAEYLSEHLPDMVEEAAAHKANRGDARKALLAAFAECHQRVKRQSWAAECGSTALVRRAAALAVRRGRWRSRVRLAPAVVSGGSPQVALFQGDVVHLVNVGDCRAIVVRRDGSFEQLTQDHRLTMPAERERIRKLGGKIVNDRVVTRRCADATPAEAVDRAGLTTRRVRLRAWMCAVARTTAAAPSACPARLATRTFTPLSSARPTTTRTSSSTHRSAAAILGSHRRSHAAPACPWHGSRAL